MFPTYRGLTFNKETLPKIKTFWPEPETVNTRISTALPDLNILINQTEEQDFTISTSNNAGTSETVTDAGHSLTLVAGRDQIHNEKALYP